jgi:acyl-CoA synthetase (AMP-forming)/AMP-acid ligase II
MFLDFIFSVWQEDPTADAIIWNDQAHSYAWLRQRVQFWAEQLAIKDVTRGSVVVAEGDFSPNSIAVFLALVERACIVVPITPRQANKAKLIETAQAEFTIRLDADDQALIEQCLSAASHSLYAELRHRLHPGLVLFSSGSTGESKAALHDVVGLLAKFKVRRDPLRTISFLLYDHIGGVNTLLHTLANRGCLVTIGDRTPDGVLRTVAMHRVELLPTSPTFLNLVLMSEAYKRHDLSSLRTITYGTEPMPESTLQRLHEVLPHVQLKQTYGLSELGIMRAKSKDSTSLWVKIGGEGFATRVVNGILQIKAQSAMLGYLNAPSPFTAEGWFDTGDAVEVDGEYLRILGRMSEIINVGGEKVYPVEVENVINGLEGVTEVTVYGERNPITGSIVCATVTPSAELDETQRKIMIAEIKKHCRQNLAPYKVPVRVNITDRPQHSYRFKKARG